MTPNQKNKLKGESELATKLKKRRVALKLKLSDVEVATKIRGKYLAKIEAGEWEDLPNDTYIRGFVRQYADYLGLDAAEVMRLYDQERGRVGSVKAAAQTKPLKSRRLIFTPRLIAGLLILVVVVTLLGYLGWQVSSIAGAPKLQVTSPAASTTLATTEVTVRGQADPGADVFINSSPVIIDTNGRFSNRLVLQSGLNVIKVTAKSKLGRATTVARNILVKLPTLRAATFNGVGAKFTAQNQAIALKVSADSQPVFSGTLLAGESRVFSANQLINFSTNSVPATKVEVTNGVVIDKTIDITKLIIDTNGNYALGVNQTF